MRALALWKQMFCVQHVDVCASRWGIKYPTLTGVSPACDRTPRRAGHRSLLNDSESFSGKLQLWPSDTGTRTTTASLRREPSIKLTPCPDLYFLCVCVCVGFWETVRVWRLWGLGSYLPWPHADCSPRAPGRQCQGEVNRTISTCKSIPRDPGALAPSPPPLPPLAKHPFRGGPSAIMSLLTSLATLAGRYLRGGVRGATAPLISFLRVAFALPTSLFLPLLSKGDYLHRQGDRV